MIKKLKIKNFKSFKDFEIEFDTFNCIIAPNNAGKSNLIEAFRFLHLAYNNLALAVEEFGGFNDMRNIFLDDDMVYFEVEFLVNNKKYLSSVNISKKLQQISYFNLNDGKEYIENLFSKYFFAYAFYPEIIKTTFKGGKNLRYDGTNLVEVLNFIKEVSPNNFENISASLIGVVDELNDITLDKDLIDRNVLLLKEKDKLLPFNIVSDGTINLLAILTAIFEPSDKKAIAFDEIEKHLHLRAVDYILEVLKSCNLQVFFTTQSSEIINNLNLENDNLIFLYRDYEGFTKAISAKKIPNFNKKVKRYKDISTIIKNEVLGYLGDFDEN